MTRALAALVLVAGLCAAAVPTTRAGSTAVVIRAGKSFQRVGPYVVRRDPTLRGAIRALGAPTACRVKSGPSHVGARWAHLGIAMELVTFGLVPPGKNGCTAPGSIRLWYVAATGERVRTSLGLRVGNPVARLRRLYPRAERHGSAYWLVTGREFCLGDCPTRYVTVSRLTAKMVRGRVSAFVLPVGAQGE